MLRRPSIKNGTQKRVICGRQHVHATRIEWVTMGRNEDISTTEMSHTHEHGLYKRTCHSDSPPFDHVSKQFLTLFKTSIGLGVQKPQAGEYVAVRCVSYCFLFVISFPTCVR